MRDAEKTFKTNAFRSYACANQMNEWPTAAVIVYWPSDFSAAFGTENRRQILGFFDRVYSFEK